MNRSRPSPPPPRPLPPSAPPNPHDAERENTRDAERAQMLINRIRKNERRLKSWRRQNNITCYRLYHRDIPEIPAYVDTYEGRLHVSWRLRDDATSDEAAARQIDTYIDALHRALRVPLDDIFVKLRIRASGGSAYGRMSDARRCFQVSEGGHRFHVNLSDYLDTGLFLDHRQTRALVQAEALGRDVLNLFAYTGAFSVYAAAGGARTTTTVDLSNTWLDTARDNMHLNGFTGEAHRYVRSDILADLESDRIPRRFDLVVLDPPTVSKSTQMTRTLDIQRDHAWLINRVLRWMRPGGVLYFSNNFRKFRLHERDIATPHIADITAQTVSPDFAQHRPHVCYRIEKR
ncbi:MAG: class I SAM-dependent methyltransferase [Proteobacteria bacterium]|nr:class I SAM-dependent methyltransferase [Pseudomonadota bacterium]